VEIEVEMCGRAEERSSVLEIALTPDATPHPFAGLGRLHALLLAGFVVNGVLLDFLDDRFLLDFPFEPAQGGLEAFAFI
jgi:hypothetical protein